MTRRIFDVQVIANKKGNILFAGSLVNGPGVGVLVRATITRKIRSIEDFAAVSILTITTSPSVIFATAAEANGVLMTIGYRELKYLQKRDRQKMKMFYLQICKSKFESLFYNISLYVNIPCNFV